jgi:C-terminal processing protease CtpA/Prc
LLLVIGREESEVANYGNKQMKGQTSIVVVLSVLMSLRFASAQDITAIERSEIIDHVVAQLANRYVDPNLGKKAARAIEQKDQQEAYGHLKQKAQLLQALVADMYKATRDKHLQLVDSRQAAQPVSTVAGRTTQQIVASDLDAMAQNEMIPKHLLQQLLKGVNYGLKNAKVLEGNVAYLDIRDLISPRIAPEMFKAIDDTLKPLLDCSALILDLRFRSSNGSPETVMYIASYLFGGEEPLLLYESYDRASKKTAEFRTRTDIPQKRMSEVPVYILVGPQTSSAGEMLAYGLQKLGRAKIVGETSAGAAQGTERVDIGHGIMMVIPVNRLAHVKTNGNWQGTGVIPDIPANDDDALSVATRLIRSQRD